MALPVVSGATIMCTMGMAPGNLMVTSQTQVMMGGKPAATIMDTQPLANLTPCGMCTSLMNPIVQSATTAALGVLTPMPCIPCPAGQWICAGTPLIAGKPSLTTDGKLMCAYGGQISIIAAGQATVHY